MALGRQNVGDPQHKTNLESPTSDLNEQAQPAVKQVCSTEVTENRTHTLPKGKVRAQGRFLARGDYSNRGGRG